MATRTINTKLAIQGESTYKQALKDINSSLSTLQSQLRLTESEFQNHQNSLQALQTKEQALKDVQDALTKKVQNCKDAYSNAQQAMSKYQQTAETSRTALDKVKTALDSMDNSTKQSGQQWLDYQTKIEQAEAKLKELEQTSGDTSEEEAQLRKEIDEARAAMDKLDEETGGAAKTAGELLQQQKNLQTELDTAEAGYTACGRACNSWQKEENKAQIALNNVTAELELNEKYLKEAETASDECATSIDEFGNKVDDAGDATSNLYNALVSAGLIQAIKKVAEAFKDCVDAAADFEAQMSTVEAISGATQNEMQELTTLAKEMGATTKFTATEAGEALEYMAMAGWTADDMLDGLAGIMNLAAAAGEDLSTTSDIVTDALTAFGLSASDSAHFSDVLAQASANSNTNVSMLGESFKMVATTAGSLNYSIDDVSVALGAMANQGLKGETAGTALATALTRMSGTNETASAAMEKLGLTMFDSQGNAKDLATFLSELRDAFSGLNQQQIVSYTYQLAGQKGMKGLQAIVNTSAADWNKLTEAIAGCSGASESMAQTKLDNYAGQVTLLESAFDALKTEIGSDLTPALGDLAEITTNALGWMTDVIRDHPSLVAAITGVVTAIGLLISVMAVITFTQIPALKAAITGLFTVIEKHPVGLLITAVAALAAGIVTATTVIAAHAEAQKEATNTAKALTETIEEQRKEYENTKEETKETTDSIKSMTNELATLAGASNKSASETERMAYLVEQLNDLVPELALEFDKETGSINLTADALRDMADAQAEQLEYEDAAARYNELLDERERLTSEITLRENELNEAQTVQQEMLENDPWATFRKSYSEAYNTIQDNTEALSLNREKLEDVEAEIAELDEYVNSYAVAQEDASGISEQAAILAGDLADELVELRTAYDEAYDSALESIQGQAEAWETLDEVAAMSSEDILSALDSQIEYWSNYESNIQTIMSSGSAYASELVDAYQGNAAAIAGLASMTKEELDATGEKFDERAEQMASSSETVAEAVTGYTESARAQIENCKAILADPANSDAMFQAALDMLEGFASGVDASGEEVDEATQRAAQEAIDTMKEALDENSPSKVFEDIGKNTMLGFTNGVDAEDSNTQTTLQTLAQRAIDAFKGVSNDSSLIGTGTETVTGYLGSVTGQTSNVSAQMSALAQNAMNAFKGISNAQSLPGAGSDTIEGFIAGFNGQASTMTGQMKSLAKSALKSVTDYATASALYSAGSNTIQGYINGVNSKSSSLYSTLKNLASNAISKFKSVLGISSPSKVFAEMGKYTDEGYIQGVEGEGANVLAKMEAMAKSASESFRDGLDYDLNSINAAAYSYQLSGTSTFAAASAQGSTSIENGYNPNSQNDDIKKVVMLMREDLSALSEKVGRLRIQTDTGAIIAEFIDPFDEALSRKSIMASRGV